MKALKSPLAKQLLADAQAKHELRTYLADKASVPERVAAAGSPQVIELRSPHGTLRLQPVAVPKAA
ncbi:hypothetical protein AAW51_2790 [Caldimonas brevitalea]|uniref:Uncharacterized protein n=2 Tax=Caldimonas brevitalea TaxID=413882 RepID=A0A0G3BQ50_9BURK|nr:hypothetical protein AAW51_2790 [Caldimonas brevitalea]